MNKKLLEGKVKKHKELGGTTSNFLENEKKYIPMTKEEEQELLKFIDEYDKID